MAAITVAVVGIKITDHHGKICCSVSSLVSISEKIKETVVRVKTKIRHTDKIKILDFI